MRLAELNTFHQMQVLKRDIDTSQLGGGDCFRNASYNSIYIALDSAWCESLPEMGQLRFDYVSPLRAPDGIPPSAGSWGCSFEGYNPTLAPQTPAGASLLREDSAIYGNEDDIYNEKTELNEKFSTLHGKEQFVQELVENLFAKKFEPRSKAKRKETRACPKNILPTTRAGAGFHTGQFVAQVAMELHAVSERSDTVARKVSYVERIKALNVARAARAGAQSPTNINKYTGRPSALTIERPATAPSTTAHHTKSDAAHAHEPEAQYSSSESSEDDYFERDEETETEESNSPQSPHSPYSPSRRGAGSPTNKSHPKKAFSHLKPNHTGLEPKKKPKKKVVNKFMELYIAEVSQVHTVYQCCQSTVYLNFAPTITFLNSL